MEIFRIGETVYAPGGIRFEIKRIERLPGEKAVLYGDNVVVFAYRCTRTPRRFGESK